MILSNIRIEDISQNGKDLSRLVCDVENCSFSMSKEIYYIVPREYVGWLADDVYDSFMVAMLFPIMRYNEPLEIDGYVSKRIYLNLTREVAACHKDFDPSLYEPKIKVKGFADAKKNKDLHVGTGFAAGVDSFTELHDNYWYPVDEDRKIDTLFSFHVDNYGDPVDPASSARAEKWYNLLTKSFADKVGLNSCFEDSNIFEFHPQYGTDLINGFLGRISMTLSLQRGLKCFYFATDLSYGQQLRVVDMLKSQPKPMQFWEYVCSGYVCPLLSNKGLELISDGSRYNRGEKIELIANDPYVKEFLNVCTCSSDTDSKVNCSHCRKCLTTMLALEIIGKLDDFKELFDVDGFRKNYLNKMKYHVVWRNTKEEYSMVCLDLAKKYNYPLPSRCATMAYVFAGKVYMLLGLNKIKKLLKK